MERFQREERRKLAGIGYLGETMYDYNNDRLIFKVPLRIGGGKTV
jgi:hypothetical protein